MRSRRDSELGMGRAITRRDVLHGFGAWAASSFVPGAAMADALAGAEQPGRYYPPGLTGLRGNHDGAFEVAHALAREGKRDWGPVSKADDTIYDLVVVGAGLSGLAAAHFFLKDNPDATVLLLDNHDDFGGHAKRNEFQVGGKTIVCHGGSRVLSNRRLTRRQPGCCWTISASTWTGWRMPTISISTRATGWPRVSISTAGTGESTARYVTSWAA